MCKNFTISLIQRHYRRILNIEELREGLYKAGFQNINILTFEDMMLKQQMQTVYCTDIMVGVYGAGLQWALFMKPGSGLLELGWHHWDPGWYANMFRYYQEFTVGIIYADKIKLNFESYTINVRKGKPLSEGEMYSLSRKGPANTFDNQWKWADGIFNVSSVVDRVIEVAKNVVLARKNIHNSA